MQKIWLSSLLRLFQAELGQKQNLIKSLLHHNNYLLPSNSRSFRTLPPLAMDLKQVVSQLEGLAPTSLAESWDNVGLLIEPSGSKEVRKVLLTNDLTEPVLLEAVDEKVDLVISYHPPLFRPLKRLTKGNWKERVAVRCVEERIAVFSPHTSWDAVNGGINNWLLEPYGSGQATPVTPSTAPCHPGGFSHTVAITGTAVATDQLQALLSLPDISVSVDASAITVNCSKAHLSKVFAVLPGELLECATVTAHELPPLPNTGAGRRLALDSPLTLEEVVTRTKKHLCLDHIRLALGNDQNLESKIKSIAVCAGSGASVLRGCRADLLLTGEMSHHEVLDFVHKGISVILTEHSNCERGYLRLVKDKLVKALGEEVTILVSKLDRDPLQIV